MGHTDSIFATPVFFSIHDSLAEMRTPDTHTLLQLQQEQHGNIPFWERD